MAAVPATRRKAPALEQRQEQLLDHAASVVLGDGARARELVVAVMEDRGCADLVDRPALRVGQVPVEVALAGDVGALVAAAHRHDDVGPLGELGA